MLLGILLGVLLGEFAISLSKMPGVLSLGAILGAMLILRASASESTSNMYSVLFPVALFVAGKQPATFAGTFVG
jgi:hypothetical protein